VTDLDWNALAQAAKKQRVRLGRTQEQLAQYGGPSSRAVRDIESGRMASLTEATLAKLDRGLGWRDGTAQRVLTGEADQWEIGESAAVTDDDARALRIGRAVLALLRELESL
jgi:transcriptional regulator with XRE-family HTH domain